MLRDRAGLDASVLREWWTTRLGAATGTTDESAWLGIGAAVEIDRGPPLQDGDISRLGLNSPAQCRAALRSGIFFRQRDHRRQETASRGTPRLVLGRSRS